MNKDSFEVEYEYVPSKQSEIRLQRAFEIIFEKIIKTDKASQISQISKSDTEDY